MEEPLTTNYDPARWGCTADGCRSQDTRTLDGRFGRRCASHAPWLDLAAAGQIGEAFDCLRDWMFGGQKA